MRRPPRLRAPATSLVTPLRCNDLLFVNAYFSNGQRATQAYMTVHPTVKYTSAEVLGHRQLRKVAVQAEIASRMQSAGGITREFVESNLLVALRLANESKDAAVIASVSMDCAKLAGFLVEKREIRTLTDEDAASVRALVRASLRSPETLPVMNIPGGTVSVPVGVRETRSQGEADADVATPHPTAGAQ